MIQQFGRILHTKIDLQGQIVVGQIGDILQARMKDTISCID